MSHPGEPARCCNECVMDTSDRELAFDAAGVCNYCREARVVLKTIRMSPEESERRVSAIAREIRTEAEGREYDSIIGLSGGVDSSYVALLAHRLGLRPLAVHLDNGWDSELAVQNITNIVEKLGFDLHTHVIDWEEFKDLQRSFLKASVLDLEMLSDHAIFAVMFRLAKEHDIRYVLSGTNLATEYGLPRTWAWLKQDLANIRAIQARYGTRPLRTFPTFSSWEWVRELKLMRRLRFVELLNHIPYRKDQAMRELEEAVGWRYYGGKHYESIITKFYQAYILPTKWGIDKRRAHLSALIRNGEITRTDALGELAKPAYDSEELRIDRPYVLKKLGLSEDEFEQIMTEPPRAHTEFASDERILGWVRPVRDWFRRVLRR